MTRKLKSGEEITSIGIKRKTIALFQILKLMCGKTHVQILEEIAEAFEPLIRHYYEACFVNKEKLNLVVSREGAFVKIGLIPKLPIHEKPSTPIVARFDKSGKFKGVVEK